MKTSDLKKWLKANKITRSALAQKCHVSKRTVDGWFLREKLPEPAGTLIEKIMTDSLRLTLSMEEFKEVMKLMSSLKIKTMEEFISTVVREKLKTAKTKIRKLFGRCEE